MEITANQLLGLPIYSLEQGEKVGQVRSFLLDTKEKELIALLVANKKLIKEESVLCLTDVAGLSAEAITVDSPEVLRKKNECAHLKDRLKNPPEIAGLSVIKKDGTFLGKAESFYIDAETGGITKIELDNGFFGNMFKERIYLTIDEIDIIGTDMILAKDSAEVKEGREPSTLHSIKEKGKEKKTNLTETAAGCGEKIMAMSGKLPFRRNHKVIFPEVETAEEIDITKEMQPEEKTKE